MTSKNINKKIKQITKPERQYADGKAQVRFFMKFVFLRLRNQWKRQLQSSVPLYLSCLFVGFEKNKFCNYFDLTKLMTIPAIFIEDGKRLWERDQKDYSVKILAGKTLRVGLPWIHEYCTWFSRLSSVNRSTNKLQKDASWRRFQAVVVAATVLSRTTFKTRMSSI